MGAHLVLQMSVTDLVSGGERIGCDVALAIIGWLIKDLRMRIIRIEDVMLTPVKKILSKVEEQ